MRGNGESSKTLLEKVEIELQKTGKIRYAEACILQFSLLVQVADDPFAFGIMGPCTDEIKEGFERYRVATAEVLWQLAGAKGLTCDQAFEEITILEELKRSVQSPNSGTLAEVVERGMIQEFTETGFLTAPPAGTPSSVQFGGQSSFRCKLSERFRQTYGPYTIPWSGENLDPSTQQHQTSLVTESKKVDCRESVLYGSYLSKTRRARGDSLQKKSSELLLEGVLGDLPLKIKGMGGVGRIVEIYERWRSRHRIGIVKDLRLLLSVIKRWKQYQRKS